MTMLTRAEVRTTTFIGTTTGSSTEIEYKNWMQQMDDRNWTEVPNPNVIF